MTKSRLSPRDRRALVTGAMLLGALVLGTRVVPALSAWSGEQRRLAEAGSRAVHEAEAAIARRGWTQQGMAQMRELLAPFDSAMLTGSNVSAAGTAVSEAVSVAAEASGSALGSIQLHRDSLVRGQLTHVSARATLSGDAEALALFLETVEVGPPLLAIRQTTLSGGANSSPGAGALRLEVVVEGVFLRVHHEASP